MATRPPEPALRIEAVRKTFPPDVTALDGFGATVRAGAVTGLIGPDGAGKTTLMRLIAGLLAPDGGRIVVIGTDVVTDAARVQVQLGYMPQRFGLYEDLTVQENLDLYADLHSVPLPERPQRYAQLLHMTGLSPFTARLAGRLSGGMKQKLGLACVLVGRPRLLLLDEPTVGVDPVSRRELWQILYTQVREQGLTVLLSTAYLDEAERCQEVILLHRGRKLGQAPPRHFIEPMRGRVYRARTPNLSKRRLQQQLLQRPEIADAVIQGDWVRLVTRTPQPPRLDDLHTTVEAVAPRLEDAFIVRLLEAGERITVSEVTLSRQLKTGKREAVIRVRNLKRRFGDFYAVKGISFEVYRGEVFGLLGANGAGKTTTFRMLCGLLPVSEGEARVAGFDMRHAPARARARFGYMAQKFSLYGQLSVGENLSFFAGAYGLGSRCKRERIDWALETFELVPWRRQRAIDLPLGYKQRLAMACTLLHEPDILFLDEPTSGVAPLARREFWLRINTLAEQGVTVLVTTHFMEEAEYCDRLVIMQAGEILASGSPEVIRRQTDAATLEEAFIQLIEHHP
ncbi:ABC-2 type transport system ATP-binding protein [Methylomarinovum caldicuralii]|uniref:ABC-2 type transport system ATP-binding protein n=1 Tax=Methylomarinovum caldicuralii TaxID=438856 RepID=A0AAU9CR04_9GAMM|nr:ATP-binding cassette domain-containing protein [Methylomarinovum caldicuralii]BCX81957.1 ABC-2 type transport system ATP-binding protein [Methylomarinovum caldicuralii]